LTASRTRGITAHLGGRVTRGKKVGFAVVGVVVGLLAVGVGTVYGLSDARLSKRWSVTPRPVTVKVDPATLERGRYLVHHVMGCADCHAGDLGGKVVVDAPPVGHIPAPNLTAGTLSDADWVLAIRHGLGPGGRPLVLMPSEDYQGFSDDDLAAVIAYARSLPKVERALPPVSLGPIGRLLIAKGELRLACEHVDHALVPPAVTPGPTVEYGRVLGTVCTGCHGPNLSGGPIPGVPPEWPAARNITPDRESGIGAWTEEDFARAMREGKRPDGAAIDERMPWRAYAQLSADDLRALWLFLRGVEARAAGGR
jgi:mono/diheme cytochrome c family protein